MTSQTLTLFKREKLIYRLITLAVLAAALFFVYRIIHAGMIAMPYSKELLEPSNIALTKEFLSGQSPYTTAALSRNVPGVNYDYPFLNSLIAAAIAKITGCDAVVGHFVISLLSILLSGLVGYSLVKKHAGTTVSPVLTALLFMLCHWRFGYVSAAPDDLGLLIMLATTLTAVSDKIKNKPVWVAAGLTLCFYTKQYYVFIAAGIFVYMLFYSRKDAVKLVLWTVFINAVVAVLITLNWPLYWTKAFLLTYLGTAVGGGGKIATVLEQFRYLAVMFAALFIVIIVAAARAIRKLYKSNKRLQDIKIRENDVFSLAAVQSVIMLVPLFVIGRNDGAFVVYFLQLWIPYISMVALISFERMITEKHEFIYMGIYAVIAVVTVYFGFGKLPLHTLTDDETYSWMKAYDYTEEYGKQGDVYYSRCLAYEYMKNGYGECLCGHDGEVSEYTIRDLKRAGVDTDSFTYLEQLVDQNLAYRSKLEDKVKTHEYALITLDRSGAYSPFDEEFVTQNGYRCIDRFFLQLGNMPYEVAFYALF